MRAGRQGRRHGIQTTTTMYPVNLCRGMGLRVADLVVVAESVRGRTRDDAIGRCQIALLLDGNDVAFARTRRAAARAVRCPSPTATTRSRRRPDPDRPSCAPSPTTSATSCRPRHARRFPCARAAALLETRPTAAAAALVLPSSSRRSPPPPPPRPGRANPSLAVRRQDDDRRPRTCAGAGLRGFARWPAPPTRAGGKSTMLWSGRREARRRCLCLARLRARLQRPGRAAELTRDAATRTRSRGQVLSLMLPATSGRSRSRPRAQIPPASHLPLLLPPPPSRNPSSASARRRWPRPVG